jgi:NifU-like protein involved in Fe-S cluster formation
MHYNERTWAYFMTAPGAGEMAPGKAVTRGAAGSRQRGTWIQFDLAWRLSCGPAIIESARFLAFGCPHTIAVAAWVAERAAGRGPDPALPESPAALAERFAVPTEKLGRLLLVEDAWAAAVAGASTTVGA